MVRRLFINLSLTRYLLPFVIAATLILVEGYALGTSDFFVKYLLFNHKMAQADDIKFTAETEHINADIVFVGDSSSLFDVIPSVVESATGLKTYNLGVTIDAFAHGESLLLSHYLQHNHPPKYIVLHVNPWIQVNHYDTSRLGNRDGSPQWEGIWVRVRHGSFRDIAAIFTSNPESFINFPLGTLSLAGQSLENYFGQHIGDFDHIQAKITFDEVRARLAANAGFLELTEENGHHGIPDNCHFEKLEAQPDNEYIQSFRRRYSTKDTTVLVFIAPIPDCDESLASLQHAYGGLVDLPPRSMPPRYFQKQAYSSSHTMLPGAIANSQNAGAYIRELRSRELP